ncbi:Pyridoxamine 5'-phosphate oxidase [Ferrithrix thermotolerans DSM 19514]|jgi:hypothetical protein|uniref:Pyridoxamine 5'-phosphate oxidase n=1 Tax=Ferrithrix thermotolerans DSM 19514 TaxID=1121881 RepID=A0A1M4WTQ7_9ACTN|nr:pyridoxamine 5'-phosphate oxidase family protein [Ferrithrix thermotolerans]SHE84619.1 Pyridoxamine 5'-phosphate oxidase [Ferrithrix thermotolerans DSM 19514]
MLPEPYVLEHLPLEACLYYIASNANGRLSLNVDALPLILPTPYSYRGDKLELPVPEQDRIRHSIDGSVVALETGGIDPNTLEGYSVQAIGVAKLISRSKIKDLSERVTRNCFDCVEIYPTIIRGTLIHSGR